MAAASAVPAEAESRPEAAVVAELLARAVQSGVELSNVMDIREAGSEGEAVRLALAGLAGQLIAGQYRQKGRVPGETESGRLIAALSATLTFADNFTPAAANTARLAALEADVPPVDDIQVMMQALQALTPMVLVVSEYSFGLPERKLVQDITDRLVVMAGGMAARLLPESDLSDRKQGELILLRALTPLYCEAHQAETLRLKALGEAAREQLAPGGSAVPMDDVWQVFERRAAMMEILAQTLLPRFKETAISVAPVPVMPLVRDPVAPQPVPLPAPDIGPQPYNPMAFFRPGAQAAEDSENT